MTIEETLLEKENVLSVFGRTMKGFKMSKAKPQKDSRLLLLKGRKREKYRERNIIS